MTSLRIFILKYFSVCFRVALNNQLLYAQRFCEKMRKKMRKVKEEKENSFGEGRKQKERRK